MGLKVLQSAKIFILYTVLKTEPCRDHHIKQITLRKVVQSVLTETHTISRDK